MSPTCKYSGDLIVFQGGTITWLHCVPLLFLTYLLLGTWGQDTVLNIHLLFIHSYTVKISKMKLCNLEIFFWEKVIENFCYTIFEIGCLLIFSMNSMYYVDYEPKTLEGRKYLFWFSNYLLLMVFFSMNVSIYCFQIMIHCWSFFIMSNN